MKLVTRGFSAAAVALSAALGLSLTGAHRTMAAPGQSQSLDNGPRLRLLSPTPRATFQGVKPIEIDALYEGTAGNGIVSLDLYIDGVKAQSQALNSPEAKGMVSFLVDSSLLSPGMHYVVVRATSADAEVRSVRGSFIYQDGSSSSDGSLGAPGADPNALEWPSTPGAAPQMHLMYPQANATVQGKVTIQVDASDADGKPPYVSIFVDGEMKQLVNYRPFEYEWDTAPIPNGWHTIAIVEAFDNASVPVAHLDPIRVYVNNPGGQTNIRTDLLDGAKSVKPAFTRPVAPVKPAPSGRLSALPPLSDIPTLPAVKPAHKTVAARPGVRRPSGTALLAAPEGMSTPLVGRRALLAELDPRWDGPASVFAPALSAPTVAAPPTAHAPAARSKASLRTPISGFKVWNGAVTSAAPSPTGAPLTASAPFGKHGQALPKSLSPMLLAQTGPLDERLASPLLSLPELPPTVAVVVPHAQAASPHKVRAVVTPHAATKETVRVLSAAPGAPPMTLKVHAPAVTLRAPWAAKPYVGGVAASLLRAVGQHRIEFNQTSLALERPLAARQNILFGPLRRIFEYGGGSLQWDARSGTVRAQSAHKDIRLTIGHRSAIVNNRPFVLNGVPYINSGRTMVPLSFIAVAMNANVQYDPATGHLKITSRD